MNDSGLGGVVAGRFWVLKCLLLVTLSAMVFSTAPAVLFQSDVVLPPAYALKAERPFADTSTLTVPAHEGERSHGAKLTPRLTGSVVLYLSTLLSLHPYMPATVFGIAFLLSGILVGYRVSGDRLVGLFLGLTFAGLYASSACFAINWMPKPFDGIAIGLVGLTMASVKRPWLLAIMTFLSCWTDERAFISLLFIGLLVFAWPEWSDKEKRSRVVMMAVSALLYLVNRAILSKVLGWEKPDVGMINLDPLLAFTFAPLAAWSCFEGGWLAIALAIWILWRKRDGVTLSLLAGSVLAAIGACLVVLDVSRVSAFAFPLIPLSYVLLRESGFSARELRMIAGGGAIISLLAPNFEILQGIAVRWLQPLPPYLLQ